VTVRLVPRALPHDAGHNAFMTLPAYSRTREAGGRQPGHGPTPCRVAIAPANAPTTPHLSVTLASLEEQLPAVKATVLRRSGE